ncbi:MAG: S1C family serine protease [Bacilli bacterium]
MKKNVLFILLNVFLTIVISLTIISVGVLVIRNDIMKDVEEKQQTVVSEVESDIEEIYNNSVNGVVYIESTSRYGVGTGSGFIYKIEGNEAYILTNYHVIAGANQIDITTNNNEIIENVEYLGGDELYDIAVLKSPVTEGMIELPVKDTSNYNVGEHVLAIGSPLGKEFVNTATLGIISGKDRFLELDEENSWGLWLIQTDTAINPGNSGGPLFSMDGEVIGINSLKFVDQDIEGMGFAIPMDTVIPKLKAFEQGKGIRITLGFTFRDTDKGIEVRYVSNGSDADVAGLEKGDVILSFDGEELENSQDLKEKINMYVVGDVVELIVERNGKEKSIEIEFTDGES